MLLLLSFSLKPDVYPVVQISAFITDPTPFVEEFLKNLYQLNYPKSRIHLTLYCNASPACARESVTRGIFVLTSAVSVVGRRTPWFTSRIQCNSGI